MIFRTRTRAFTLIETLVAISLLSVAIVAPMSLTAQSLATAYYARDQITAFYLAQEAIEAVRSIRDAQILCIAQSSCPVGETDIFGPIPMSDNSNDRSFTIDVRKNTAAEAITRCSEYTNGVCPPLETNGTLYGYELGVEGWANTNFTRIVKVVKVGSGSDEIRVYVTVQWKTGAFQTRTFSIQEDLYRWVNDGAATT